jgi:hypothetical protein
VKNTTTRQVDRDRIFPNGIVNFLNSNYVMLWTYHLWQSLMVERKKIGLETKQLTKMVHVSACRVTRVAETYRFRRHLAVKWHNDTSTPQIVCLTVRFDSLLARSKTHFNRSRSM